MILPKLFALIFVVLGVSCAPAETEDGGDRILHGTKAPSNKYPFMISLQRIKVSGDSYDTVCGGAILSDKFVLTAAHCIKIEEDHDRLYVIAGTVDQANYDPPSQVIKVQNYYIHPEYLHPMSLLKGNYDIAVLKLATPLKWTSGVQKINVPSITHVPRGEAQMLGFGGIDRKVTQSRYLMEAKTTITMDHPGCPHYVPPFDTRICTGLESYTHACGGDSGSPLIQLENGKPIIIGVLSSGTTKGCVQNDLNLYIQVNKFLDFINTIMAFM